MAVVTPYVAVNIFEGAKAMDKSLIEMGVTFKAQRSLLIRKVYLPQLMPYIFSAFRYAFGVTWKIVALAETFGLKFGIGYMFFFWFGQFNMDQMLAWIVMFVVLMLCPGTRRLRPAGKPGVCLADVGGSLAPQPNSNDGLPVRGFLAGVARKRLKLELCRSRLMELGPIGC